MAKSADRLPQATALLDRLKQLRRDNRLALFVDFDGTLTPIVERPEMAVLDPAMKSVLERLAGLAPVIVISGRDLDDVRVRIGVADLIYAGSHGFRIVGPDGMALQMGEDHLVDLDRFEERISSALAPIDGHLVDRKSHAVAIHYRQVEASARDRLAEIVRREAAGFGDLELGAGKMIWEVRPAIDWHKGRATDWILRQLGAGRNALTPVYIGDDITDEDGFTAVADDGFGIIVDAARPTAAGYRLDSVDAVRAFLAQLAA